MRLIAKFGVAFFLTSFFCFACYALFAAERSTSDQASGVGDDLVSLGNGIGAGIAATLDKHGTDAARELVDAIRAQRGDVLIEWRVGEPPARREGADVTHLDTGEAAVRVTIPVHAKAGGGTLVLTRRILDTTAQLRRELLSDLAATGALALSCVAVALVLGSALIGRPLALVVAQARRIGAGDLSQRLGVQGTDEIAALTRELNVMCDRLEEASRRVDEEATLRLQMLEQMRHLDRLSTVGAVASGLAHELGTPLNVLLIRGQALEREPMTADEVRDAGGTIVSQVNKMSRLVRQLLDFSRRKTSRKDVRLSQVAEGARNLLASIAKKHGVTVKVDVESDATVFADPTQLEQAVTNLVTNAIQAMPSGGQLTLRVKRSDDVPTPDETGTIAGGILEVEDTGTGMTDAVLNQIFQPFYTTKPEGYGTGLGLSVASGIARDHGGFIRARSTPEKGSTFALVLPRQS